MALVKKYIEYKDIQLADVPKEIKSKIEQIHKIVSSTVEDQMDKQKLKDDKEIKSSVEKFQKEIDDKAKNVRVYKVKEDKFQCMIQLMNHVKTDLETEKGKKLNKLIKASFNQAKGIIEKKFQMKLDNEGADKEGFEGFDVYPDENTAKQIWEIASKSVIPNHTKSEKVVKEAADQFNTMSIMKILQSVNSGIIDSGKVSDSNLSVISTEVTKKMLPKSYGRKFSEFKIKTDSSAKGSCFEFEVEAIPDSSVAEILDGKLNLYDLISAKKIISVKATPKFLTDSKGTNDFYYFCDGAIKFFAKDLKKLCNYIQHEFVKLDSKMKDLIKSTELKKVVSAAVYQCLIFKEAKISSHGTFSTQEKELKKIMSGYVFKTLKSYKEPEKNKDEIIKTFDTMIKGYKESNFSSVMNDNLIAFFESAKKLYNGNYQKEIKQAEQNFINNSIDWRPAERVETQVLVEKFGVKRLKKIPSDLLPYIRTQIDRIEDENDKMMLGGYTQSKIEIVEWYIELLTVGSDRYIVPHTLPQLQRILQELNYLYKKIMNTRATGYSGKPVSYPGSQYPPGYNY